MSMDDIWGQLPHDVTINGTKYVPALTPQPEPDGAARRWHEQRTEALRRELADTKSDWEEMCNLVKRRGREIEELRGELDEAKRARLRDQEEFAKAKQSKPADDEDLEGKTWCELVSKPGIQGVYIPADHGRGEALTIGLYLGEGSNLGGIAHTIDAAIRTAIKQDRAQHGRRYTVPDAYKPLTDAVDKLLTDARGGYDALASDSLDRVLAEARNLCGRQPCDEGGEWIVLSDRDANNRHWYTCGDLDAAKSFAIQEYAEVRREFLHRPHHPRRQARPGDGRGGGAMKTFRFQGYSDDTFGEYEQTNDDYDNCASATPIRYELKTPDGAGVIVTGMYNDRFHIGDGWMIGVNVIDEAKPVDEWMFNLSPSHEGYRNRLMVLAPDDAVLRCLNRAESEADDE